MTIKLFGAAVLLASITLIAQAPGSDPRSPAPDPRLGYTDTPDARKMRAFFEWGNKTTLDALAKRFASGAKAAR